MKKLVLLCLVFCAMTAFAQKVEMDKELTSLVDAVKILRTPGEGSYNRAKQLLMADTKWTPMNETGDLQPTECRPSETPGFKLNRMMTSIGKERKHVVTKSDMLNGEDARYSYSLYERSLKKGKSATYSLKNRKGKQTIVLVPYSEKKGSLTLKVNGKKPTVAEQEDGTLVCAFNATGKELSLSVSNQSGAPLSFVILNYNSRK